MSDNKPSAAWAVTMAVVVVGFVVTMFALALTSRFRQDHLDETRCSLAETRQETTDWRYQDGECLLVVDGRLVVVDTGNVVP